MKSNIDKITQRMNKRISTASLTFGLIEAGDRILVCLSGGKDSYTMLDILLKAKQRWPIDFELVAFHLDQKQPGYPADIMRSYFDSIKGLEYEIVEQDTYSIVQEKLDVSATPCSLCSRLRRGIMYRNAEKHGCNKIALGHHRDDSIETLLLNLFHNGKTRAMPAKYRTEDGRFEVIRPLIYVAESDIEHYSTHHAFPIIPCNLCGSLEGQRRYIKNLLTTLEKDIPGVRGSLLSSLANVHTTHLLDQNLYKD